METGMKKIEKLLFATKFREPAFDSLKTLFPLKKAGLNEIVLCYVIPVEQVGYVPFGGYLKQEEERLRTEAELRFEDWEEAVRSAGIGCRHMVGLGEPVPKILSIAKSEGVQMIVAGKKRFSALESAFVGSETLDLMRRSPVPLLLNKHISTFKRDGEEVTRVNDRIFENPFLAADWSRASEAALEMLMVMKGAVRRAAIVHVLEEKRLTGLAAPEIARLEEREKERLASWLKRLRESGIQAESHLAAGIAESEIIKVSREFGATMIITGTTGKDRLREFFIGSVSHRVAEESEVPVLLVPAPV